MNVSDPTEYRLNESERYAIYCAIQHCIDIATCDIGRIAFRDVLDGTNLSKSISEEQDWNKYEFTEQEFSTILDALSETRDNAVHSKVHYQMKDAQQTLITQSDHHDNTKQTTSPRFRDNSQ